MESEARYEQLKTVLSESADLLIESNVNGRPIATFKLKAPVQFADHIIDLVELPAPKPSKPTTEGFEHIEIICDVPFSALEKKYTHLNLNRGGLKKDLNQELELHLGPRNLKFHHISLESVIKLERNQPVSRAIQDSKILNSFKKYTPLITGTFPLGLEVKGSDVDLLMNATDLEQVEREIAGLFSTRPKFRSQYLLVDQLDTLILNFDYDDIPFEIFVQNRETPQQTAFLHFLIEERLLKLGGQKLKERVLELRNQGLKTELAFARALNLKGDPYAELLKLQKYTGQALIEFLKR